MSAGKKGDRLLLGRDAEVMGSRRLCQWPRHLRRTAKVACPLFLALLGCEPPEPLPPPKPPAHSSSIAITADGTRLFTANADSDSISILDPINGTLIWEVLLAAQWPRAGVDGTYTPAVRPRALALSTDEQTVFVTGERSGRVHAVALPSFAITTSAPLCSEPIGILAAQSLFVACAQDAVVLRLNAKTLAVEATVSVPATPWALAWSADTSTIHVTHLLGPGVSSIEPGTMKLRGTWPIAEVAPRGDKRLAHGVARSIYDVAARPGSTETWAAHAMLGIDTPQPDLDFESTTFPTLTAFGKNGAFPQTLSIDVFDIPGADGAFADIVSGPRAIAFTPDGDYALMVNAASEDVLVVDARTRLQVGLVRPLHGDFPEGLVLSPDGTRAYVEERGSSTATVIALDRSNGSLVATVEGPPIRRTLSDPMPPKLRLGQRLFYSANSDEHPITRNHWVACATCHPEGRSDAVTWKFLEGPRDTPTNGGGTRGTGFLSRTGQRTRVQDYWEIVNREQGGDVDPVRDAVLLDALAAYVDLGIPAPVPPSTDAALVAKGKEIFERADVGCATCHPGPRFTDSGQGNDDLALGGTVLRHDVGTCRAEDVDHEDIEGHPRARCQFDTPSLTGIASTAPYLHDGSAATLREALEQTKGKMGDIGSLSPADLDALVEYMRSL